MAGPSTVVLTRGSRIGKVMRSVVDILVIVSVVGGGLYIMNHPEKIDFFLNWLLRRNR
jgi:hypothetical protein